MTLTISENFKTFYIPESRKTSIGILPLGIEYLDKEATLEKALSDIKQLNVRELLKVGGGGVLFRGLPTHEPEAISKAIEALDLGQPFEQLGAAGKRSTLANGLQTANEGPPSLRMWQHNERARYSIFPTHIIFASYKFTPISGGRTPIASSIETFEILQKELPEFTNNLIERKLETAQYYPDPDHVGKDNPFSWRQSDTFGQDILESDDLKTARRKAENRARKFSDNIKWTEDNALVVTMKLPAIRRLKENNIPVLFSGLGGRYGMIKQRGAIDPPHIGKDGMIYIPPIYGDGGPINRNDLEALLDIQDRITIYIPWQESDILVLDNFKVQHAREPWIGKQEDRVILASLRDDGSKIGDY